MATVKAKCRMLNNKIGFGKLYIQIIHNRQARKIQTPYTVATNEWDEHKGIIASPTSSTRQQELDRINRCLHHDIRRIKTLIGRMEINKMYYDTSEIITEYHDYMSRFSFTSFMERRIGLLQDKNRLRTAQNYRSTFNSFMMFRKGEDIVIDSITTDLIDRYEAFLQARGLKPNTTSFYMRVLRAVCNAAADEGAFVLSFLTRGMSFIDMAFLLKSNLKNGYLTYCRHKTRQPLTLKWTVEMQRIIDKYPPNTGCYLLPILINPHSNPAYAYRNISYRINTNLKKIGHIVGYHKSITLYSARHSWASIARMQGIPISVISEGMGHDSERTTRIYLSTINSSAIDRANTKIINSIF